MNAHRLRLLTLGFVAVWLFAVDARSELRLPAIISDHMVLQSDTRPPVWGWTEPGESVLVRVGEYEVRTTAQGNGAWIVRLPRLDGGQALEMTVSTSDDRVTVRHILVGETWVCSGQSNMQWPVERSAKGDAAIRQADYPRIRLFTVPRRTATQPQTDCEGKWVLCNPDTVASFSAVGYYFGRELHEALDVPVGLIHTSWGGTPAEAWTSGETMDALPEYTTLREARELPAQHRPSALFNGMIVPLIPYQIRGAIWYQGESNASRAFAYRRLFPAMIEDWRQSWGQGDFPFYFVQIAPYAKYSGGTTGTELREAQFLALATENTGMVVTTDIATIDDIHPPNKQDVGKRLALWALAKDYGRDDVVYSGPLYKSMRKKGNRIELTFDHVGGGLVARGGELTHFTIAGADRQFVEAQARIKGKKIVVWSEDIDDPVAVRFGWADAAEPNLFNEAGLPASTFRTDDWPGVTHPDNGGKF